MCDNLGTEYWTIGTNGTGYCSTTSLEDAVINHIREENHCKFAGDESHGSIVDIKIIHRELVEKVVYLKDNDKWSNTIPSLLEQQ